MLFGDYFYIELTIAATTFASEGIVLDIANTAGAMFFFCKWWSDFSQEEECLYMGGLTHFQFTNIRNIPKHETYAHYIVPITMLQDMIGAHASYIRKATKKDLYCMARLISEQVGDLSLSSFGKMNLKRKNPPFVTRLFKHFTLNVETVKIAMNTTEYEQYNLSTFGFKMFESLFMVSRRDKTDTTKDTIHAKTKQYGSMTGQKSKKQNDDDGLLNAQQAIQKQKEIRDIKAYLMRIQRGAIETNLSTNLSENKTKAGMFDFVYLPFQ